MPGPEAASDRNEGRVVHRLPGRLLEVAGFFDDYADTFDRSYANQGAGARTLRARQKTVLELLPDAPGEVLDAGMGGGILCLELERRGWSVRGIDLSRRMVELAHARLPHLGDRLVQGSILALPYDDASFDAAVATGVLEYVEESLADVVAELARVLRPGGVAVVSLPNYGSVQVGWHYRVVYPNVRTVKRALGHTLPPPRRVVSLADLRAALLAAGLLVERLEIVGARAMPGIFAERLERSRSRALRCLGTQFVLRARKPLS